MSGRSDANDAAAAERPIGPGSLLVMPIATMAAMLLGLVGILWGGFKVAESVREQREADKQLVREMREQMTAEYRENAKLARDADQQLAIVIDRVTTRMDAFADNMTKLENWYARSDARLSEFSDRMAKLEAEIRVRFDNQK